MKRLIYLFDPLCGWCYGAAHAIHILRSLPDVALRALPVGMFAWEQAVPLARMRDHIRPADARIAAMTGQVFSETYFSRVIDQPDGRIDSGPATVALYLAERQTPGSSLNLLAAIQTARYVDGRDITDPALLHTLAEAQGLDLDFSDATALTAARHWADEGATLLGRSGGRGVPTLLHDAGGQLEVIPSDYLYQGRDRLAALLAA